MIQGAKYAEFALFLVLLTLPFGIAWTAALVPLRLIRPRPPWRLLARQPGWVAACMAMLGLGLAAIGAGVALLGWGQTPSRSDAIQQSLFVVVPGAIAPMILGAWATLLLNRRWRPERSWVDRLGRALGLYWIAMGPVAPILAVWIFL